MIDACCPLCGSLVLRVDGQAGTVVEARCRRCRNRALVRWRVEDGPHGRVLVALALDRAPARVVA